MRPLLAVIVRVWEPPGIQREVETVNVASAGPPLIRVGTEALKGFVGSAVRNRAVAPCGKPLTLKSTSPVNPFNGETHTAYG